MPSSPPPRLHVRWLALLLVALLAACGTGPTASSGSVVNWPTATPGGAPGTIVPAAPGGAAAPPAPSPTAAPPSGDPAPGAVVPRGGDPAPSPGPGGVPSPAGEVPSAAPSGRPAAAPSVAPVASAAPRPTAPAPAPSAAPQVPSRVAARDGTCPATHPWSAYTGPNGEQWYRSPNAVAISYRQPPTLCFVSEAAARGAGFVADPRPPRATKSTDGTCTRDNPVKGYVNAQGKQVYLLPDDPGYAAQRATDCFSDDGVAQYYGFEHAPAATPSASPAPSARPAPSASPAPSAAPASGGVRLSPSQHDFGTVSLGGTSLPGEFVLTNAGAQAFEIRTLDIRVTGEDASEFMVTFKGCDGATVRPGGTCTFTITFRPTGTPGARAAEVRVATGAGPSTITTLRGTAR